MILLQAIGLKSSTYSIYSQKHFGIDTQPYCTRTHTYAHYNYLHILLDVQYKFKALRDIYIHRLSLYLECISIFVRTTSTNASSISPFRCFLLNDVIIFFYYYCIVPFRMMMPILGKCFFKQHSEKATFGSEHACKITLSEILRRILMPMN